MSGTKVDDTGAAVLANRLKMEVERLVERLLRKDISLEEVALEVNAIQSQLEKHTEPRE